MVGTRSPLSRRDARPSAQGPKVEKGREGHQQEEAHSHCHRRVEVDLSHGKRLRGAGSGGLAKRRRGGRFCQALSLGAKELRLMQIPGYLHLS